jgi:hypothetical protein
MNPSADTPANSPIEIAGTNLDKRVESDRRRTPTGPWDAFPIAGHRTAARRASEHRRSYFVDRFSSGMFIAVLVLILASIADAILTIRLLEAGADEVNPLMDRLLNHGVQAFLLGKYVLTVVGLPLLLIFKNHYLFGTRMRIGYLIPTAVALYLLLISYQLFLMQRYVGM